MFPEDENLELFVLNFIFVILMRLGGYALSRRAVKVNDIEG